MSKRSFSDYFYPCCFLTVLVNIFLGLLSWGLIDITMSILKSILNNIQMREDRKNFLIRVAVIIMLTVIIYMPTLKNDFIWDDDDYVYKNELIQKSDGLFRIWFSRETVQYYPVVFSSFWFEHKLWGLQPFGYHFVNIFFHILNMLLLLKLVKKIYPRAAIPVALIFAVHPIQVETVAWITERKNILALFFFLSTCLSYLEYQREKKDWQYFRTLALFIFALLSKSISLYFVFVPILYKWWKGFKITVEDIKESVPFFVIGFLSGLNTMYMEIVKVGAKGTDFSLNLSERLVLAGKTILFYPYKILWPFEFMFFYPRWNINPSDWKQWFFSITVITLVFVMYFLRKKIGKGPIVIFFLYLVSIFPASGIVNVYPMIYSFVADHFLYLSMPPLLIFLCGLVFYLYDKLNKTTVIKRFYKTINKTLVIFIVLFLSFKTMSVAQNYKNQVTLWTDLIKRNPNLWASYINLAKIYDERNENEKAVVLYKKAIILNPKDFVSYYNLGNLYQKIGEYNKAVFLYQKALSVENKFTDVHNNLGLALNRLGMINEAMQEFETALKINPYYDNALINILNVTKDIVPDSIKDIADKKKKGSILEMAAFSLLVRGDTDKSLSLFMEARRFMPNDIGIYRGIALAYYKKGDMRYYKKYIKKALAIEPNNKELLEDLKKIPDTAESLEPIGNIPPEIQAEVEELNKKGINTAKSGDLDTALKIFDEAVKSAPNYAETYNNIGYVHYLKGEYDLAEKYFTKTLEINPEHKKARLNLVNMKNKK
ncbi:Tetratricopeptide TPR_2 repeat protein [Candidatus Omnitrophus magneticus]|uniref:Tetratricopeptide TPR_2 repeat protein n=1 Tax=Candidatus Omnitrophus magneticus TaxID=1609969 RepID=A0A0F0CTQ2_9BACT|nr:Tetratricopeptide TPR_2 repeat protein [Candidatus Omnitrophus magneticus]